MDKIKDVIKNLSTEEKETHKKLIEECLERAADIENISQKLKTDIEKLNHILINMFEDIETIHKTTQNLEKISKDASSQSSALSLKMIPDDMFYHA